MMPETNNFPLESNENRQNGIDPEPSVAAEIPRKSEWLGLQGVLAMLTVFALCGGLTAWYYYGVVQKPEAHEPIVIGIVQYLELLEDVQDGFKARMEELGYVEDRDVIYRFEGAVNTAEETDRIARELVEEDVDLLFAVTSVAGRSALKATEEADRTDIPIVWAHADHPVETGMAESLESSGNNSTGIAVDLAFLTAKRIEFLQQIDSGLNTIALFHGALSNPAQVFAVAELRRQSDKLGLEIAEYRIENSPGPQAVSELESIIAGIQPGDIDAVFQVPGPVTSYLDITELMISLGKQLSIPVTSHLAPQVHLGALFSYSHDFFPIGVQAADMADKILSGTDPSDIPIEFPDENTLMLNMRTAEDIGVTFPETMLLLADLKIE